MNFESKYKTFHSQICLWKCRLPEWWPFCPGADELNTTRAHSFSVQPPSKHCIVGFIWFQVSLIYNNNVSCVTLNSHQYSELWYANKSVISTGFRTWTPRRTDNHESNTLPLGQIAVGRNARRNLGSCSRLTACQSNFTPNRWLY